MRQQEGQHTLKSKETGINYTEFAILCSCLLHSTSTRGHICDSTRQKHGLFRAGRFLHMKGIVADISLPTFFR